jgi:triosephosphate isomerase
LAINNINLLKKMKRKIIVGNWKMNPTSIDEAKKLTSTISKVSTKLKNTQVVLCPPYVYLPKVVSIKNSNISFGAQNAHGEERGSFTGEVSPTMPKEMVVKFRLPQVA